MKKRNDGGYQRKTSYKIMMKTLSLPGDNRQTSAAAVFFASNLMCVDISPLFTNDTAVGCAPALSQRSVHQNNRLDIIGAVLSEVLMGASRQQRRQNLSNMEDDRVWAALVAA